MKIQPVVIAVIKNEDKYLLTRRVDFNKDAIKYGPYAWNLPGGGVKFGEYPKDAIKREIKEELGVEIEVIGLLPKIFSETRGNWQGIFLCFLCKMQNYSDKITLNYEADQYGWFNSREVLKLKILPNTDKVCLEGKTNQKLVK